jgi:hypothetical protein
LGWRTQQHLTIRGSSATRGAERGFVADMRSADELTPPGPPASGQRRPFPVTQWASGATPSRRDQSGQSGTEGGCEYVGDFVAKELASARHVTHSHSPRVWMLRRHECRGSDQTDDGGSAIVRACSPGERMKMQKGDGHGHGRSMTSLAS